MIGAFKKINQRGAMEMSATIWTAVGLGIVVIAIIVFFSWVGSQLSASLISQDNTSLYVPLVRHELDNGRHCYDNGNGFCQDYFQPTRDFQLTIGYLPAIAESDKNSVSLYECANKNSEGLSQQITFNASDCRQWGRHTEKLGEVLQLPDTSAPAILYGCRNTNTQDVLLTVNSGECARGEYGNADKLGYIATVGN
ncbi:MAG: hypothetical protein U1C49_01545 [Candidatus Andersenbacteria bacterium]|nr:hypothetical protein [bacterium]MDZ4225511.1 hypothetical protein [Candidatus Andersenbacteria bacterium]